ncbi:hypothetical protein CLV63_10249 [Murinocardiopsis flavida]|uniref:DUF3618 domain-containing protein n=1 Tax=Murinocardiopsis flavida TaxID=645275 RepID=A0A2P8DRS8_9ACTN|nr:hypothetical protein [Murinocardiopsis flavida]PSK99922.1 hypothetical protein CLV63_10249 [Murinocardiopsis flavida]
MTDEPKTSGTTPKPAELRKRAAGARKDVGRAAEAATEKADVRSRVQDRATALKGQAKETATQVKAQTQDKTGQALRAAEERIPQPVWVKVVRAAQAVRRNRGRILAGALGGAAALAVLRRVRSRR